MNETAQLFSGTPGPLGGLSNELELVKHIPKAFRPYENPWSTYAMSVFYGGGSTANWKWRSDDPQIRRQQLLCWKAALNSFETQHEDKASLTGWMLSEMLTEVPK
jgi:hypothetical protein